ncbi:hypothetical protein TNCV_1325731 [Trichonephila clavipes]|nr:hypothetical protein TNCV_1325731 [Trichonephila clavipes]
MSHTCSTAFKSENLESPECWSVHTADILQRKVLVYDIRMVKTCVILHKHKFCTHGTPKLKYLLFQIDIPIDLTRHGSNLNMQVSSGTPNTPPSNEQSCITETASFSDVLLVVAGSWCVNVGRE